MQALWRSSVDICTGTQMILDFFFFFFVSNDQHESAVHPCQDYPIQFFLTDGLSLCCFVPADLLFLPGLMLHDSGSDTVEQRKNRREKRHFNHSTLSVDTIRDQWHFPLLKEFILLSDLKTISMNSVMFPPRCIFQGDAACTPQHCAVLVSMLISFNGSICWSLSWTGSFEPDLYLTDS